MFIATVKVKNQGKLNQKLREIAAIRASVQVGFFADAKYDDGTPVASVAYTNEYGVNGNPARPFMHKTAKENIHKWVRGIRKNVTGTGINKSSVARAYKMAGMVAVGDIKKTIRQWPHGGNSRRTVEMKRRRGRSGKNLVPIDPEIVLIDTGKMISSVSYEVKA